MRFEITEVHVVDIPDSEVEEMDNPLEEIKDDAHWFIETYEREAWCEEVTRLGRQLCAGERLQPAAGMLRGRPRAPWNREEPRTCGECSHLLEGCCDYGICEREFEEAFESDPNVGTDSPGAEWHAACWARNWVVEHYKDMQEDTCDSFSSC